MAFHIEVIKTDQQDEHFVYYIYQFYQHVEEYVTTSGKTRYKSKMAQGKLKIDKRNGDVHILELAEGDRGIRAQRASWALIRHWEKGEFPDKAVWDS